MLNNENCYWGTQNGDNEIADICLFLIKDIIHAKLDRLKDKGKFKKFIEFYFVFNYFYGSSSNMIYVCHLKAL